MKLLLMPLLASMFMTGSALGQPKMKSQARAHASGIRDPKVVLIAIDGIRALELQGKAKNDDGATVKASELFPNLLQLKKQGLFFPNMRISNPVGISLPAYADIFAGRRQEKIVSNTPSSEDNKSHYPTIFDVVKNGLNLDKDGVAVHSSWSNICAITGTEEIYKSCGWKKGAFGKPEIYPGSRSDMDTFLQLAREVVIRYPRFLFVHLGDADEEAHNQERVQESFGVNYGIFNYHKALREDDYYVGRIWKLLQSDPFYKDSTYLIITTDHGRDNWPDPNNWANHGRCVRKHGAKATCSGCQRVFALVVGPGLKNQVVKTQYSHTDIAPTIAKLLGVEMPSALGQAIPEILSQKRQAR